MHDAVETRRFEKPDQLLDMKERGSIATVALPDGTSGMFASFEPGWKWQVDQKPLVGSPETCPIRHIGYCIGGTLVVIMLDTGKETRIRGGDFFDIPPGHDAHVEGDERVELVMFAAAPHRH